MSERTEFGTEQCVYLKTNMYDMIIRYRHFTPDNEINQSGQRVKKRKEHLIYREENASYSRIISLSNLNQRSSNSNNRDSIHKSRCSSNSSRVQRDCRERKRRHHDIRNAWTKLFFFFYNQPRDLIHIIKCEIVEVF